MWDMSKYPAMIQITAEVKSLKHINQQVWHLENPSRKCVSSSPGPSCPSHTHNHPARIPAMEKHSRMCMCSPIKPIVSKSYCGLLTILCGIFINQSNPCPLHRGIPLPCSQNAISPQTANIGHSWRDLFSQSKTNLSPHILNMYDVNDIPFCSE